MIQKRASVDRAIKKILSKIQHVHKQHQSLANQNISNNQDRVGNNPNTQTSQKQFLQSIEEIQQKLTQLANTMDTNKTVKQKPELRDSSRHLRQTVQDIQQIIRRDKFGFQINEDLSQIARGTGNLVEAARKDLNFVGERRFLCYGSDGVGRLKSSLDKLKQYQIQWNLLAKLSPKNNAQTFTYPEFNHQQYSFLEDILMQQWPEITTKQTIKTVQKIIQKQKLVPIKNNNVLAEANQYIYGINRQQNPAHGLKLYREEADKDNPVACTYLGQVYQEGVLLPKNLSQAKKYYAKALIKQQPYAFYRFGMSLIKGELQDGEPNKSTFQQGYSYLKRATENKNPVPEALVQLGELYEKGKFNSDKQGFYVIDVDIKRAIELYLKARQLNLPRASNNLGVLYINNMENPDLSTNLRMKSDEPISSNIRKGLQYLEQAKNMGFPQAYYNIGFLYENGFSGRKNPQQALVNYYKGGVKGDIQSQLKFAYQLMNQTSIQKQEYGDHYRVAHRWLDAIANDTQIIDYKQKQRSRSIEFLSETKVEHTPDQKLQALFYLALMYQYGFGVDKSPRKAYQYFSEASEAGYIPAKNKLGDCYFSGFGVKQDRKVALGCYLQAAQANNSDALVNLGTIFLNGIPGIAQRNYNLAYQYFSKAAELQNSNAMIHLSYMYKNGLGVQKANIEKAKKFLELSATQKNPNALYMLREMGGDVDEKLLFENLDNEMMFVTPRRINLRQNVPYLNNISQAHQDRIQ